MNNLASTDAGEPPERSGRGATQDFEISEFDADFAAASAWLQSLRRDYSEEHTSPVTATLNTSASQLCDSLSQLAIDSAVLWIESDGSLAAYNEKATQWLGIDDSILGERFEIRLNRTASRLAELADQMLQIGTATVQYEFEGATHAGDWYRWSTRKTRLPGLLLTGFGCLCITRPIAKTKPSVGASIALLEEQFSLFRSLDEIDQTICQGMTLGDSTEEIACEVGLTRRSIEVRRSKILQVFGFSRQVQIVRMMVRFEENGCFGT